ncbi:MAG TPA: hypothetical protein VHP82_11620 [Gaiellaceae bacterium]|jgi:hypothetical protein|nr:hypothetical protein [Gaiellaceae bacterium]
MPRRWTAAEDQLLLERYTAGESREAIAKQLGRTSDAVDARRRFLHRPARTIPTRRWSEAEETFLRAAAAAAVPSSAIASRLNRTPYAVRRRRETIGATSPRARPYTAEEDALIAATIQRGEPLASFADTLGRSHDALRLHARQLGLLRVKQRRRWTVADDERLRYAYTTGCSVAQTKQRLLPDRSEGAIVARAHLLGLAEHGRRWTNRYDTALARMVGLGLSSTYIARTLGRTEEAIAKRCRVLGLRAPAPDRPRRRGPWTAAEDGLLRARAHEPLATLVFVLGRSRASIRRRRHILELATPPRTQHHPLTDGAPIHGRIRAIKDEMPLTATRALALAKRLKLSLTDIRRLASVQASETPPDVRTELKRTG